MEIEDLQKELQELNNSYQQKFKELSEKIDDIKKEIYKIERFKPEFNQDYYMVDYDFTIISQPYNNESIDSELFEIYNFFKTKEEAEKMSVLTKNFYKVIYYLKAVNGDWKPDLENVNWIIFFEDYVKKNLLFSYSPLSFKSEESLDLFREYVTDEEIKLFLYPMGVE